MTRDAIEIEIKAHKSASNKAYKAAKKAVAVVNKIMSENHFNLAVVLTVGDKRKKT